MIYNNKDEGNRCGIYGCNGILFINQDPCSCAAAQMSLCSNCENSWLQCDSCGVSGDHYSLESIEDSELWVVENDILVLKMYIAPIVPDFMKIMLNGKYVEFPDYSSKEDLYFDLKMKT